MHGLEREWARSLIDLLHRRSMAGLDADFGSETAVPAAQWLVRLGIWDEARARHEVDAHRAYARSAAP